MKNIIFKTFSALLIISCLAFKKDEPVNGPVGSALKYKDKIVFIMTTPVNAYTVVDKDKPDSKGETMTNQIINTIDDYLKKETKGKISFDAVIVKGQYKKMEFIKFNDASGTKTDMYPYIYDESRKAGDKYVYFGAKPLKDYDVVHVYDVSTLRQSGLFVKNNAADPYVIKINSFCEKAINQGKDKNIAWDAIIVKQNKGVYTDQYFANDFGAEIEMIKFK